MAFVMLMTSPGAEWWTRHNILCTVFLPFFKGGDEASDNG
jgi:hypothetical protein